MPSRRPSSRELGHRTWPSNVSARTPPASLQTPCWSESAPPESGSAGGGELLHSLRARMRGSLQASGEIRLEIFECLDADGQADETIRETCLQARRRIHRGMGHGRRMGDQTLDAA